MEKSIFWKVLLVAAMSAPLFSCSDDDEPASTISSNNLPVGEATVDMTDSLVNDELVFVEGGTFYMGAQANDANAVNYDEQAVDDEADVHLVSVSSFYMTKNEVTQALWNYVMYYATPDSTTIAPLDSVDRDFVNKASLHIAPAYNVTYNEIVNVFIPRLNKITGIAYRLPTEAEWEYAARGGQNDEYTSSLGQAGEYLKFAGSNNASAVASFGLSGINAVMAKQPNALGLYDMSGNVWEWCSDWYGEYSANDATNPQGPSSGEKRVVRGGDWSNFSQYSRVSYRTAAAPDYLCNHIGFRLVVSAE